MLLQCPAALQTCTGCRLRRHPAGYRIVSSPGGQGALHCLPAHVQVWIYRDKATGQPKGDGTVTYEDPFTAGSAVSWFSGKEFKGEQCGGGGVPLQAVWCTTGR